MWLFLLNLAPKAGRQLFYGALIKGG